MAHATVDTPAPSPGDVAIRLEGVEKRYGAMTEPVVERLDLEVRRGELLVLVGPSGCGKSTTLRMMNRMVEPSAGRILFDGEDVTRVDPDRLRRTIGYAIQNVGLFPHWTIAQNVGITPRLLGWSRAATARRVDEMLDLVGLDPALYRDRYPAALSGGQAQRAGVARALAGDPPVILMDEPFGAIDQLMRDRLQIEFRAIQRKLGKTVVFVTHDIDEAFRIADRIAVLMNKSRIAQIARPHELLVQPANAFVAQLVGSHQSARRLSLMLAGDILLDAPASAAAAGPSVRAGEPLAEVLRVLLATGAESVSILAEEGRPAGTASLATIRRALCELAPVGEA